MNIFKKIATGELPCHKVYEDDKTIAFLDIKPQSRLGHVLVIPKVEVDKVYDLPDEHYEALFATVKKLARHMDHVLNERITYSVFGNQIPYAHVHLMPFDPEWNPKRIFQLSEGEMKEILEKLRLD